MKKKILCVLLSLTMTLPMAGCGLDNVFSFSYKDDAANEEESSEEEEEASDEASEEASEEEEEEAVAENDVVIVNADYNDEYLFDTDGNFIRHLDDQEILDVLKLSNDDSYAHLEAATGTILFYQVTRYDNGVASSEFIAFDYESGEVVQIQDWREKTSYGQAEVYKGKIFFTESHGSDESNYRCYEIDQDNLEFTESASDYVDVLAEVKGYNINCKTCYDHQLDEYGVMLARKDDSHYAIYKDGTVKELEGLTTGMSSSYMDQERVLYTQFDTDTYEHLGLFELDLESGDIKQITDKYVSLIAYEDGVLYYLFKDEIEFEVFDCTAYRYDVESGEETALYTKRSVPGVENYSYPGDYAISIKGGKAYYLDFADGEVTFKRADVGEEGLENEEDTGVVVNSYSAFEYGTIDYETTASYCENCGIPFTQCYVEYFNLDSKYSEYADVINEKLHEKPKNLLATYSEPTYDHSDEDCEEHAEYPQAFNETDTYTIEDVGILEDKYLYVTRGGYWYGGGAHGMPNRGQQLFDLTTGEELHLSDFYTGTEEDFKELVATKTKEDFESYGEAALEGGSPYFQTTPEDVYNSAYECVQYAEDTDYSWYFQEDGLLFFYYPYDMGSYATGFIEIFIPYEELLGRSTLSEN